MLRPNGRALSRAALQSEKTLTLKPDPKIALILSARSGVGYSAVLGGACELPAIDIGPAALAAR